MEFAKWTTRKQLGDLPKNSFPIDVSMDGYAMSMFDPCFPHGKIPLPDVKGYSKGIFSDTVQGAWESLGIVNGRVDSSCLHGKPKKRTDPTCKWAFGGEQIGWTDARQAIYIPTFAFMFENRIPNDIKISFYNIAKNDIIIYFYDNSENPDPMQLTNDFSHAFLVQWFMNREFKKMQQQEMKVQSLMTLGSGMDFSDLPTAFDSNGVNWDKIL
jgi:hypothetical protein